MNSRTPTYHGYRYPPAIISHAVWLYHRFSLSFRDVEDLLAERGTRVAALFYSLNESAKLAGVEPRAYLGEAARRAIRNPGAVTLARDFK
jgi:hypothetical protein